ncbi:MAG: chemotaxis protein CheW [Campylobacterota bacterium]
MNQLLEQFLNEARDNLSYLDENLESLQDEGVDMDALFRAAHTLKGGAGLVGFESVQTLTHKAEDILDKFRHNEIEFSERLLEVLYDIFDEVVEIVDAAEELGDIPEVDDAKIQELADEAKEVLSGQTPQESEDMSKQLQTHLNFSQEPPFALQNFKSDKLSQIVADLPPKTPVMSNDILVVPTYYLLDFDLDVDTITLGNDPYYLLSLFDDELKLLWLNIAKSCEEIEKEPLKWATRILAVVESDEETIEDICENILDEITVYPISQESYFLSAKQNGDGGLIEEFKDEFSQMLEDGDFSTLDEHINAALKLLNPDSKESFLLSRLHSAIVMFDLQSSEFEMMAQNAAKHLDIEVADNKKEDSSFPQDDAIDKEVTATEDREDESAIKTLDENTKKAVQNILNQQKQILHVSSDDETLQRVKHTISTVLQNESVRQSLQNLDSATDIESYIDRLALKLDAGLEEKAPKEAHEDVASKEPVPQEGPVPVKTQKTSLNEAKKEQPAQATQKSSAIGKTVKIDQYQIDSLMDNIGELLVMKNSMPYIVDTLGPQSIDQSKRDILSKYDEISRVTSQLQETVMAMRLLPLSYIFGRYPKLVRDLSKKLDKKIKYEEEGGDTKLDKTMIENLADPMVHLIRNSIDHGIESKEKRLQQGKSEAGTISIKAHSQGDKVIINIADDGAGIDPQVILHKALENNLVDPDKADEMSKEDILGLIFYSGLTTKEQISDLSGRGVGMDAVRTAIEKLNGHITVTSELEQGTNIKLELPVSVALTNVFHVMMGDTNYAIAMDYLIETSQVEKKDIEESNKRPFLHRRGELLPIVYPKALISVDAMEKEIQKIVILQAGDKKFALVVDEFVNQLDVVQKPLTGALKRHPLISGSSLLGNGSVLFILDVNKLTDAQSWA